MRTTPNDVIALMDDDLGLVADNVQPFLAMASSIVDNYLVDTGQPNDILAHIEKNLAAHFASMKYKYAKEEKVGDASWKTGYTGGSGLNATPYGETALMLDQSGALALLGGPVMGLQTIGFNQGDKDLLIGEVI